MKQKFFVESWARKRLLRSENGRRKLKRRLKKIKSKMRSEISFGVFSRIARLTRSTRVTPVVTQP